MSYSIVSTKVDPQTKKEAMETAAELGMPLSVIIKAFLKQFIRTKSVSFSAYLEEEPSDYMIQELKKSEEDVKAGRVSPSFTNAKDALTWLDDPNATYANGNKVRE